MFGAVSYLGICFAVACVLTFLYTLTRPINVRDDIRSWRVMMALLVIAIAAPYGFVEGLTLWHLKELEPAAKAALAATDLNGKVNYMKVMSFRSDTATVMCSATEKMDWGGVDKAVVRITLVKKNMKWTADKFQWVFSENRDKDGWTLPPYF